MTRTLLLIAAFLALMIGSFIWFVATWDRDAEQPVSIILDETFFPSSHNHHRPDTARIPTQYRQPQRALS